MKVNYLPTAPSVVVRVRPFTPGEHEVGAESAWSYDDAQMWQTVPALRARAVVHGKPYRLDKVFGADTSTAEIHSDQVAAIVRHVVRGFNGCVLAYGQTCSGKTTTIRGPSDGAAGGGLIAMSVKQLLEENNLGLRPLG